MSDAEVRQPHPETLGTWRQKDAAEEGASRRLENCRHSNQRIFSTAAEPGFCHVLAWLDWSDLHRIRVASKLSQNTYNSGSSRLRIGSIEFWRDPACVDTNDILAQGKGNKRSGRGTRQSLDNQRRCAKAGALFCAALQTTYHTHSWDSAMDKYEVLGLLRKWQAPKKNGDNQAAGGPLKRRFRHRTLHACVLNVLLVHSYDCTFKALGDRRQSTHS